MSSIQVKTGCEGPRHDPYHFNELTVRRQNGNKVRLHQGLGVWLQVELPGKDKIKVHEHEATVAKIYELFEYYAGITPRVAEKAYAEAEQRPIKCHPCGQKHIQCVSGHPGETLLQCEKCGVILGGSFNEAAII